MKIMNKKWVKKVKNHQKITKNRKADFLQKVSFLYNIKLKNYSFTRSI